MGVLGAVSKLVALVAVAVGTIGKVKPELFLKLPMGFIPWAMTGNFVPPYFDNAFYKSESFRDWVRDGDVVVSVGAKSGTTWMCYCADAIRRKGAAGAAAEASGLLPYTDIMFTTPWIEMTQAPGQTWAEREVFYKNHVFADGTRLVDYWDNAAYPFRVFKSHMTPDTVPSGMPYSEMLPVTTYPKVKYVTMVRNGYDVSRSMFYFFKRHRAAFQSDWGSFPPHYPSVEDCVKDLLPGGNIYSLYFPYVKAWWALKDEPNVLLMHYSDAVKDHGTLIATLAAFYGVSLTGAEQAAVAATCSKDHMKAHASVFDYVLPMAPHVGKVMEPGSFINPRDVSAETISPETAAAWEAAVVAEFDDPKLRVWAADGGATF